ncbi:MAG: hypothetical protein LKM32_14005 [Chiayiivirga sp.]|jgi:hypothetical protein|uniref:hypothetical protein n=1 Tax=Chiayiivirga sp. TaxID=2041042 RepID=UPI0025C35F70|nr:hypothetical protein [Chiayiivirga sp.]MCI1710017.1 hypothetical protein [Chiayiivirga sp.]MCI1730443.1 hypothetical protein [Chiayiivirga sp.]
MNRAVGLMLASVLASIALPVAAQAGDPPSATLQALLTDEHLGEVSGIVASRRHPGIFWVHNDGDNAAELYAIDAEGQLRATLQVAGVRNVDWEDLAAFESDGKPYLLIADVGDNGGLRRELALRVVEEPAVLADVQAPVAWSVRFRWPDGPRDCESVAVDMNDGAAFLVSKKRVPPELFRVALQPSSNRVQTAKRVGALTGIEQPSADDLTRNPVYGRYRAQITAADISRDGRWLAVLNYRRVYLWPKQGQGWGESVAAAPRVFEFPWIPQAEALAFDLEGRSLWISSERLPAPLMRIFPIQAE